MILLFCHQGNLRKLSHVFAQFNTCAIDIWKYININLIVTGDVRVPKYSMNT